MAAAVGVLTEERERERERREGCSATRRRDAAAVLSAALSADGGGRRQRARRGAVRRINFCDVGVGVTEEEFFASRLVDKIHPFCVT